MVVAPMQTLHRSSINFVSTFLPEVVEFMTEDISATIAAGQEELKETRTQ